MRYTILPHVGAINLETQKIVQFGMRKNELHDLLACTPMFYVEKMEYYENFRVDYADDDTVSAIEFFNTSELYISTNLEGINENQNLFSLPFSALNRIILKKDPEAKDLDSGVISLNLGIGTYHEDAESDICESIILFKEGYYKRLGW